MTIDIEELRRLHAATMHALSDPMTSMCEFADLNNSCVETIPALLDTIEGLTDENRMLADLTERFSKLLTESRANDRICMAWLADCKQAAGYEGDFPGLVERIKQLRKEDS